MLGTKHRWILFLAASVPVLVVGWPEAGRRATAAAPVITAVVDGATLEAGSRIGGGAWVTVYGTDLAPRTRPWAATDFAGDRAPVALEGVSVRINGKPAFVAYLMRGADFSLSYDQINVLAPADDTAGSVPVEVTTPQGKSAPFTVSKNAVAPAVFPFDAESRKYAAAMTPDSLEYLGPLTLFGARQADRPIRPAAAGELIALFGSGFGATVPPVADGAIARGAAPLAGKVTIRFGTEVAQVEYAGAAPNLAGVYQLNVRVPDLPAGEVAVTVEVEGTPAARALMIAVARPPFPGWNHGEVSDFRLTGAHVFVECTQCHVRSQFAGTPRACAACHLAAYEATRNPNHVANGFPKDCTTCHITSRFAGAMNHQATRFPLTGAHISLQCSRCHTTGQFTRLDRACANCHLTAYDKTANPSHVAANFPKDCGVCHSTLTFAGARFDHSKAKLPLAGAHATVACASCHAGGQYSGLNADCAGCHLARYQNASNPNHAAAGFPTHCTVCHTTASWKGAVFNHSRFALTGAHTRVQCASCHVEGRFAGTPADCASCHLARYTASTNPSHLAAGFPRDCALCHSTTQFQGARFAHTRFTLTGAHTSLGCARCHASGQFAGASTQCASCHLARYTATANPNHVAAGFPHDCALCHNTTQFRGAVFDHARFPIYAGSKHAGRWTSCATCHVNAANFREFSCLGCHDKPRTDPKHAKINGYAYNSANCYGCHPRGDE